MSCSMLDSPGPKSMVKSSLPYQANLTMNGHQENRALVLQSINNLSFETVPIQKVGEHDVLIRMSVVGICGSDIHYLAHGGIGKFVVEKPMIMGHEGAGIIQQVGSQVTHLRPGDRVAVEPGIPCRRCRECAIGKYNICQNIAFCATPPYDGNLRSYYVQDAAFCYKIPDHVSLEEAAMIEPLSVAVHAHSRAQTRAGDCLLITGCGPIGLVSALVAKASGCPTIIMTDIDLAKLKFAKEFIATHVVNTGGKEVENAVVEIGKVAGVPIDRSIECSGAQSALKMAVLATRPGGTVCVVGHGQSMVSIPIVEAVVREITLVGSFRYCHDYQNALSLVSSGMVNVKPLITHHFKFEESVQAFELAKQNVGIKIQIHL